MYITYLKEVPKEWYEEKKVISVIAKYGNFLSYTYENGMKIYKFVSGKEETLISKLVFQSIVEVFPKESIIEYIEYSYINDKYKTDYVRVFKSGEILKYNYGDK